MDILGTHTVDAAEENIVQQRELFPEGLEEATVNGAAFAMPTATAAEPAIRQPSMASPFAPSSNPGSLASTSEEPRAVPSAGTAIISAEERATVLAAFEKHGERLVEWRFESPKLRQPRLREVLLALVKEGIVKREEGPDAIRYSH